MLPKFHIKLKPLLRVEPLRETDPKKVLRSVQREILKQIRDAIQAQAFSPRAKAALKKGFKTKMGPSSIKIIATHPAFFPLLEGQKREQMTWLTKAKRPIPIVLDNGEVIFRNASPRSMANGKWYHPGRKATTVLEIARKKTRSLIKTRLVKEFKRQLRAALAKAK